MAFWNNSDNHTASADCRWTADRLPLLAGGELTGAERRKVERHKIVCPACRDRADASGDILRLLHAAAALEPAAAPRPDAPSLWPALERQILEARHDRRPAPAWFSIPWRLPASWADAPFSFPPTLRPSLVGALALTALAAGAVGSWSHHRLADARAHDLVAARPLAPLPSRVVAPRDTEIESAESVASATPPGPSTPQPPPVVAGMKFDYDLDRGTPAARESAARASY